MHPRVKGVEVLPPYGLRLTFRDGSSGIDVDLDPDTLYELAHRAQEKDAGNPPG